jgi:hypothetical protein
MESREQEPVNDNLGTNEFNRGINVSTSGAPELPPAISRTHIHEILLHNSKFITKSSFHYSSLMYYLLDSNSIIILHKNRFTSSNVM